MRFALEVAAAVRVAVPSTMPPFWRVSAVDHDPQGLDIGDTVRVVAEIKKSGIDVIDTSSGGINGPIAQTNIPQYPGHQVAFCAEIRREGGIATMAVGLIDDGAQAEEILTEDSADLVALGRELLADSALAYRAARALKIPSPERVLPLQFSFYLARREHALSASKRQ
jgi:2,4-dienoyl-CoA reductase-like NADH-dependent reductase (Old Yellow Enzyme family)